VIFLTEYARRGVLRVTGPLSAATTIIPHGLNSRFQMAPKAQQSIFEYSYTKPYRILYVSTIDQYKHQWHVVEAVAALRKLGLPVALDLVGPAYPPALLQLNETISRVDAERCWAHYHGPIPYSELHEMYAKVDMGIGASTCETFGLILLEKMAAGLPIGCSRNEPMPEVVGDTGLYFDPEQPDDILRALRQLIESPQLRTQLAHASHRRAQQFSWQRCADETFGFLVEVARQYKVKND
jgi:glycosyltransferase involved in cell wall biosynthesis